MEADIYGAATSGTYFWSLLQNIAGTLIGAAFGAYFAFRFERFRRRDEQIETNVAEGNNALFLLGQLWNVLRQYQTEVIEPYRDDPGRWLKMSATIDQPADGLTFDLAHLGFLFASKNPNILNELLLEQRRFQLALNLIKRRSHLLTESAFPNLERAGIGHGENVDAARVEEIVGVNVTNQLKQLTNGIVENVDENVASFQRTYEALRTALKEQFSGSKFIRYAFDGNPPQNDDAQDNAPPPR